MNRLLLLIAVAGGTFLLVLLANKPEMLEDIWIWLVGLVGGIFAVIQVAIRFIKDMFHRNNKPEAAVAPETPNSNTCSLKLVSILNNGGIRTGQLFVNNTFYCFTLEASQALPAGKYTIQFDQEINDLTQKYRDTFPEWFTRSLRVSGRLKGQQHYLTGGGNTGESVSAILLTDSLQPENTANFANHADRSFKSFYNFISQQLNQGTPVTLAVFNENWIQQLNQ